MLPTAAAHPHAPWMVPSDGGSHLTFALAAALWEAGSGEPWLRRATEWCWAKLERPDELSAYLVKFSLDFLDTFPTRRAPARRSRTCARGSARTARYPSRGGTENERLTPLTLSQRPGARSRALFTDDQIEADLDLLEQRAAGRRRLDVRLARVVAGTIRGVARGHDAEGAGHAARTRPHRVAAGRLIRRRRGTPGRRPPSSLAGLTSLGCGAAPAARLRACT